MPVPQIQQLKAEFFKALAHPARIRILEILGDGDHTVAELQALIGLEPSNLSQQLGVLRRANFVAASKEGLTVRYSLNDPRIGELLTVAKQILIDYHATSRDLLEDREPVGGRR